jgi:hypothetical protein
VLLLDAIIHSGATIIRAISELGESGVVPEKITVVSLFATKVGLEAIQKAYVLLPSSLPPTFLTSELELRSGWMSCRIVSSCVHSLTFVLFSFVPLIPTYNIIRTLKPCYVFTALPYSLLFP